MGQNFLRRVEVALSGKSGSTIRGGGSRDLRIRGAVRQWGVQSPNMLSVRIYNPSRSMASQFQNQEFSKIVVSAGYEKGNFGQIFSGDIKQSIYGHETAVDTYLEIFAADGQSGYEQGRVGSALAAGHTPKDKIDLAVKAMAPFGISMGLTNVDLSTPRAPRGAAFVGMARDLLRTVSMSLGATWSIQDGQVHIVDPNKPVPGSSVKLNAQTGLIGWPKQTADGLEVSSLINSALRPHVNIEIDPSLIQLAEQNNNPFAGPDGVRSNTFLNDQRITAGTYNIFHLDRFFDTRGQEFYDVSLSVGKGASPSPSQASQGYTTLGSV